MDSPYEKHGSCSMKWPRDRQYDSGEGPAGSLCGSLDQFGHKTFWQVAAQEQRAALKAQLKELRLERVGFFPLLDFRGSVVWKDEP